MLEDVLTLLRDGVRNSDPSLTKFLSALEALIDAAADPEADPYTLDALEAEARSLDTGGQFSAVLTSAVRGALRLPEVPTESADSSPSAAPQDTAAPLELSTAAKFEESADLVDAPVEEMIENVTRELTSATAVSRGRPVQSEPVETDANKATWAAAELTSRYEGQIASAIDDGYFGIAAWMASALGSPDALLHTTVLARALRNPKGPVSNTLVDAYVALSETGISGGRHVKLVAWAASLQAALVAPETGIAELAVDLDPCSIVDGAEDLTAAVLQCALRGVSLVGAALSAVGDLASLDEEVARRSASVQTALQTRRYR